MKFSAYALAALLVHVSLPTHSAVTDPESCALIDSDALRLACYDAFYPRVDNSASVKAAPAASSEPQAGNDEGSDFGAEQLPPSSDKDQIEARLLGDFTGWTGKTIFRLDNGQVWQQTNNYIRNYSPRDPITQPKVTITKGMFTSYNLRVEGVKRIVQVKRIE